MARVHVDGDLWRWVKAQALLEDITSQHVVERALNNYRSLLEGRRSTTSSAQQPATPAPPP